MLHPQNTCINKTKTSMRASNNKLKRAVRECYENGDTMGLPQQYAILSTAEIIDLVMITVATLMGYEDEVYVTECQKEKGKSRIPTHNKQQHSRKSRLS